MPLKLLALISLPFILKVVATLTTASLFLDPDDVDLEPGMDPPTQDPLP